MREIIKNKNNVLKFKSNRIIEYLFDEGLLDLNRIVTLIDGYDKFSKAEYEEILQMLGYTVDGFLELSLVRDKTKDEVWDIRNEMRAKDKTIK